MKSQQRAILLSIILGFFLTLIIGQWVATAADQPASPIPTRTPPSLTKIDADLQAILVDTNPDTPIRFIVHLHGSADLQPTQRITDPTARRALIVDTLQKTAVSSRSILQPTLDTLTSRAAITRTRSLWLINALAITGSADAIATLAASDTVTRISLDASRPVYDPPEAQFGIEGLLFSSAGSAEGSVAWGVAQVDAPYVWHAFGIDGQNTTVAFVDSGVDFTHPDLNANYRGNLGGGSYDHSASWYSPAITTNLVPTDTIGHGTHVAGTAVGQNGIGVAPGANWIAVNVASPIGLLYNSDIHDAFAWLLAPNGDATLAPDVVNNSWSGPGDSQTFLEDVDILQAAGIITVFANGNTGPAEETVGAPASYTNTIAIGASDDIDAVAWFSSRGPSPQTDKPKPWVVAPGTQILSAYPGGLYAYSNGTSMATPHAVGLIALMLAADPTLTRLEVEQVLADTAVPITTTHPNPTSGYGRIDASAAIAALLPDGTLTGAITVHNQPAVDATITLTPSNGSAFTIPIRDGDYHAQLPPGQYTLTAAAFGALPTTLTNLTITENQTTILPLALTPLPGGTVSGKVTNAAGEPLVATVSLLGTSLQVATDANGRYQLTLPNGLHKLTISAAAYKSVQTTINITTDATITQNGQLDSAATMLIVDSGQWYYLPQSHIYQNALATHNYTADIWSIRNPFNDLPSGDDLLDYDIVFWSNPSDSPGYIYANKPIVDYLDGGGNLFISGQNVASYDGSAFYLQQWFYSYLQANAMGKTFPNQLISGAADTDFANTYLVLNGGTSASNQGLVDMVSLGRNSFAEPIFYYENGQAAGLQAGICQPFRIVYTGFGLEGVRDGLTRGNILQHSIDYFERPSLNKRITIAENDVDTLAIPGETLVYTLTVQNINAYTDTIDIGWTAELWPSAITTPTLTLGPCQSGQTAVAITIPADTPDNFEHLGKITAVSRSLPYLRDYATFAHKIAGDILFVNDYRFYNRQASYQQALDAANIPYDTWDIGQNETYIGAPRQNLLNAYDIVLWYTGYDWFQPISPQEEQQLTAYLSQGGRLFLSSQDFMYYHTPSDLAQTYFGAASYEESLEPTELYAAQSPFISPAMHQPLPLDYPPYQNNSDGLLPATGSDVWFWHDRGMAAAISTVYDQSRTILWAVPWELLTAAQRAVSMQDAIGWLSDLGDSTFTPSVPTVEGGKPVTYTLVIANDGTAPTNQVSMTNALPPELRLLPATVLGDGAVVAANGRSLSWQGTLAPGDQHTITYQAIPDLDLPAGTAVDNPVTLRYSRHNIPVTRTARLWVNTPNFWSTHFTSSSTIVDTHQQTTLTLNLQNDGFDTLLPITGTIALPREMDLLNLDTSAGTVSYSEDNHDIIWHGTMDRSRAISITAVLSSSLTSQIATRSTTAVIEDSYTTPFVIDHTFRLVPYLNFLPFIAEP